MKKKEKISRREREGKKEGRRKRLAPDVLNEGSDRSLVLIGYAASARKRRGGGEGGGELGKGGGGRGEKKKLLYQYISFSKQYLVFWKRRRTS